MTEPQHHDEPDAPQAEDASQAMDTQEALGAPAGLIDDLRGLFDQPVFVPREMDEAILTAARQRLAPVAAGGRQRRRRLWLVRAAGIGLAAAAAITLVVWLQPTERPVTTVAGRADIDRNGRVDILDAFALARQLKSVDATTLAKTNTQWDINGDGAIDRHDVDAIAARAVSLAPGARS